MSVDKFDFIVVGGGIAGVTCAENLAFLNPNRSILIVSESALIKTCANITHVTKLLLAFDVTEARAGSLTQTYGNIRIVHDTLVNVTSGERVVLLKSGARFAYEEICLCMGARPKLIGTSRFIVGIRDTDSVRDVQQKLSASRRVVIVGNGGIATELVHQLKHIEIVWTIKDAHISATFVDAGAAQFFRDSLDQTAQSSTVVRRMRYGEASARSGAALGPDWREDLNISGVSERSLRVAYQTEVVEVVEQANADFPVVVKLTNGEAIECDLVISATGVIPNTNFGIDVALKIAEDRGIAVDDQMRTSVEHVFAAGDICTCDWTRARHWFQMRLWTQARQMGAYAAKTMTKSISLDRSEVMMDFCFEMFAHSTTMFGFKVALLGLFNGQTLDKYELLLRVTKMNEYIKLVIKDGRIQGAVLIGDTNMEETIENLILNQIDVSPYGDDLLNPDIDIEDYFD